MAVGPNECAGLERIEESLNICLQGGMKIQVFSASRESECLLTQEIKLTLSDELRIQERISAAFW